jgi:hypothetical protein
MQQDGLAPVPASHKKESPSLLEKRSKRLLCLRQRTHTGHGRIAGASGELKVFWLFSSEKKDFP